MPRDKSKGKQAYRFPNELVGLSNDPRQLLQGAPVVEAFLFGAEQRFAWVAVLVEVLREAAFRFGEADEVIDFVRLGFDEEIRFLGRIALEAEALGDLVAFARIVDQHREHARDATAKGWHFDMIDFAGIATSENRAVVVEWLANPIWP